MTMTDTQSRGARGWVECGTCGGKGEGSYEIEGWAGNDTAYVDCPDCVEGLVPPDGMVEAACEASWSAWWEGRRRPWHLEQEPSIKQLWREHIRAALVAAERWEER